MRLMQKKRIGTAIPLVLCVSTILLLYLAVVWKSGVSQTRIVKNSVAALQCRLMAMSGVQHLMLKVKLMTTELYDAAALAQGKNPMFNFSAKASTENPGPRFITKGSPTKGLRCSIDSNDDFTSDPGGWFVKCGFADKSWPKMNAVPVKNSQLYLWKFCADVTNLEAIQPVLAIKKSNNEPYEAIYQIISLDLMGQKGLKKYSEDYLNFEVVGTIITQDGKTYEQKLTRSVAIKRR